MNLHISPFGVVDVLAEKQYSFEEFLEHLYSISELPKASICVEKNFQILCDASQELENVHKTDIKKTVLEDIFKTIKSKGLSFADTDFPSLINSLIEISPNCLRNFRVYSHFRQQGYTVRNAKSFGFSYMLTASQEIHSSIFVLIVSKERTIRCNEILLWTRIATNMNKVGSIEISVVPRGK